VNGLHLIADCLDCACAPELLTDASAMAERARGLVARSGLHAVAEKWHSFSGLEPDSQSGFTGMLLLAESHLAIHTWPELRGATLDVHVCNFGADNTAKAHALLDGLLALLAPARVNRHEVQRGVLRA
jgi:S-adenosylmethionine decarboxylase